MRVILGLTGSIGMGKSTTATMFAQAGIPVWDADATVHKLYAPDGPAPAALEAVFPGVVGDDGHVSRDALRALIAKDPAVLDKINGIVHPLVARDRAGFLEKASGLVVLDIPLLFETGADALCDKIAVVSVDAATQRQRVLDRGTMTDADFETILSRQTPDAEKRKRADYIIDTSTLGSAQDMVSKIIEELT
ncbi:dephospho-CoA kinase [Cognatishimia sp. F0-27]|nr:dephospho-CoA kinase [Cognatishimia sp. F0-27]